MGWPGFPECMSFTALHECHERAQGRLVSQVKDFNHCHLKVLHSSSTHYLLAKSSHVASLIFKGVKSYCPSMCPEREKLEILMSCINVPHDNCY